MPGKETHFQIIYNQKQVSRKVRKQFNSNENKIQHFKIGGMKRTQVKRKCLAHFESNIILI